MAKEAVSKGEWSMEGTDSAVIARNKKQSRPRVPFASLPRSRKQHRHRAKHCEGRRKEEQLDVTEGQAEGRADAH